MLDMIPNEKEMTALVGKSLYDVWNKLCALIDEKYDEAQTYHDGKWIMFEPVDIYLFNDFIRLLRIKRKPNRK